MTTIKVKFRPSTIDGHPGTIVYAITHRRIVRQARTEYKIHPQEWDAKHSRISDLQSNDERRKTLRDISQRIAWDHALLRKIVTQLSNRLVDFSADDVVSEFAEQSRERSFFTYMRRRIACLRRLNRHGTADNYQSALNSLSRYMQGEDLRFEQLTSALMQEYESWLRQAHVTPNSSSAYFRSLRAVYRQAIEDGLVENTNPFKKVYTGVAKTQKRAITLYEIKKNKVSRSFR